MSYGMFAKELKDLFLELRPDYIGKAGVEIGTKIKAVDGTPVTDLDNYALAKIRALVSKHFPDDFTIGEEDQKNAEEIQKIIRRKNQHQWTIDGLDGTGNLRAGLNSHRASVSRRLGNHILFAAIFRPIDSVLRGNGFFLAEHGKGALEWYDTDEQYHNLRVAPPGKFGRIVVMLEGSSKKFFKPPITNLGLAETTRPSFSSCVAATAVARGDASALVTIENKPWDNWPAIGIIEEAGGIVTDFNGNPRDLENCGNMVAAANKTDLERILGLLNAKPKEA